LVGPEGLASEITQSSQEGLEGIWPLALSRLGSASEPVQLALSQESQLSVPYFLVETTTQSVIPLSDGQAVAVSLEDIDAKTYSLVAGEGMVEQALAKGSTPYLLKLGNFPNPFNQMTRIRYELPAQHKAVSYDLRISDVRGRVVFSQTFQAGAQFDFIWNGQSSRRDALPAGHYKMSLTAKSSTGATFKARRDLLKL
jgi:FlgD Ig-like domain